MNVAVFVKASLDPNMLRVDSSGKILVEDIPLAISEYDRNAVEEAIRIKEKHGGKVVAFSVLTWGPVQKRVREAEQVLREALAMGADEAYLLVDEALIPGNPHTTAEALAAMVKKVGQFDLYLTGEGSMDTLSFQVAARLGEALGIPSVSYARAIEVADGKVRVTRDLEEHLETVEVSLPAVVSVTGEINKPRLPTLLQIRRAFAKPLNKLSLADVGYTPPSGVVEIRDLRLLAVSRKNIIVEGSSLEEIASKLVDLLVKEGIVK